MARPTPSTVRSTGEVPCSQPYCSLSLSWNCPPSGNYNATLSLWVPSGHFIHLLHRHGVSCQSVLTPLIFVSGRSHFSLKFSSSPLTPRFTHLGCKSFLNDRCAYTPASCTSLLYSPRSPQTEPPQKELTVSTLALSLLLLGSLSYSAAAPLTTHPSRQTGHPESSSAPPSGLQSPAKSCSLNSPILFPQFPMFCSSLTIL